jgi:hypothetical protein
VRLPAYLYKLTQICNLTRLSCLKTVFTLKSMPTVLTNADVKLSSAYLQQQFGPEAIVSIYATTIRTWSYRQHICNNNANMKLLSAYMQQQYGHEAIVSISATTIRTWSYCQHIYNNNTDMKLLSAYLQQKYGNEAIVSISATTIRTWSYRQQQYRHEAIVSNSNMGMKLSSWSYC